MAENSGTVLQLQGCSELDNKFDLHNKTEKDRQTVCSPQFTSGFTGFTSGFTGFTSGFTGSAIKVALVAFLIAFVPQTVFAQKKYTPESEEVIRMINDGVAFLDNQGELPLGLTVLMGLAAYKAEIRNGSETPEDHPLVKRAIAVIEFNSQREGELTRHTAFEANYVPALALALLLDIGSDDHERIINELIEHLIDRQQTSGGYGYKSSPNNGDVSQIQYVCLAFWTANRKGYDIDPEIGRRALDWIIGVQEQSGGWMYTYPPLRINNRIDNEVRHSLVASGAGTVYVIAEWLKLASRQNVEVRKKRQAEALAAELELRLPPSVTVYNPEQPNVVLGDALIQYDLTKLTQSMARANSWFSQNFRPDPEKHKQYYLYAFERYASLRELVEGKVTGVGNWYDEGVEHLRQTQLTNGNWQDTRDGTIAATSLAILFLTRSMQLSLAVPAEGTLRGGEGFPEGESKMGPGGQITSAKIESDIDQLLTLLDKPNDGQLAELEKMVKAMRGDSENISRTAQLALLRQVIKHPDAEARLLAVKIIGQQRELGNVPALIYAMTDPDLEIARVAHEGLRFISRKVDSMPNASSLNKADLRRMRQEWKKWYLSIRPGARLLEEPEDDD